MSIYKKLMEARLRLQAAKLEKTGCNKFAGYQYFELGDFIPTVQEIFSEVGLCGVVSYTSDIASLSIHDVDGGDTIVITSPMGSAALKGCHEVQNIGAVETYQRRYLWVTAMEIVEHDALDATTGKDKKELIDNTKKPNMDKIDKAVADAVRMVDGDGEGEGGMEASKLQAHAIVLSLTNDEKVAFQDKLKAMPAGKTSYAGLFKRHYTYEAVAE